MLTPHNWRIDACINVVGLISLAAKRHDFV